MSLVDQALPPREEGEHASQERQAAKSYTDSIPRTHEASYTPSSETYDRGIFDAFYLEEDEEVMAPSPKQTQKAPEVPALPPRSALRASKLLDSFDLKLAGPVQAAEMSQATPHDFYLSSEEDASSSADDFSDYEYELSSEEPDSPIRRKSREDTARVVSVIYVGKPSIIDLSLIRRSISPSSLGLQTRTAASKSAESLSRRPATPPSDSDSSAHPPRKSSMLTAMLSRPKPNFLKIDPYANGSTYSLEPQPQPASKVEHDEYEPPRTPRTPTALLQGMSRTLSLVKKRSRPALASIAAAQAKENMDAVRQAMLEERALLHEEDGGAPLSPVRTAPQPQPQPKMTYNDIMRVVKKNLRDVPRPPAPLEPATQQEQQPQQPASPAPAVTPRVGVNRLLGNFFRAETKYKGDVDFNVGLDLGDIGGDTLVMG